jgi:NAD(P)-dependent dehydrogenase (short-subunit alcohol dehydrogenase family)
MSGVLIVTGSARGIGAATAVLAAADGYAVCINYREKAERAEEVVQAILDAGGDAIAVSADISVEADVMNLFETVDKELGTLTALVNNAATVAGHGRVDELTMEQIDWVLGANVAGTMLCAREAVRRMSFRHGGAIVNVSSVAARLGAPGDYVHLAATKGAVDSFTVGLAREVTDEGIRVNAVRPGLIDTEIHADAGLPNRVAEMGPNLPMGRAGTPEEVASAILWLLSDKASYASGTILDVSGAR